MEARRATQRDWRKARLLGPIAVLTLSVLALLVFTVSMLVQRFDETARNREQHMVVQGFDQQVEELNKVVATQVDWDDAIKRLDHQHDAGWADFNIGNYLYTFNGFTRSFVIDGSARVFYASVGGTRGKLDAYKPFEPYAAALLPAIRKAEAARPPLVRRPGKDNIVIPPIQANTIGRIDGQVYLITATLVQPDFAKLVPRGPRAPVTITALPLDSKMLAAFAKRYQLDGLTLADPDKVQPRAGRLLLGGVNGAPVAALTWQPRAPSRALLERLLVPMLFAFALICAVALTMIRRSGAVVSDLIASEARAKHLAFHDPLTRLPNRAMLFERLQTLIGGIGSSGKAIGVLCVDLDRFKEINDSLGHHAGDTVIETMASRLRAACGSTGLIARLGGDEFVVLVERTDARQVTELAHRLIAELSRQIDSEYGRLEVGCSIGAVLIEQSTVEPTEALRWADLAMYRSKQVGRGRVTLFEPEMDQALKLRRALEADLRDALLRNELHMVYQPQVDMKGRITAVEALVRWNHPVRGEVPPAQFVPLAEESNLILLLGEFVLRRVFSDTRHWRRIRVAINVSAEQMRSPGFAALVARLAATSGIDPARYEIELTETALLGDEPATASNIAALKRLGFSFALDDFGTGYSSLSVLQRFSVDKIKIDRSFVSCLDDDGESEALIDAMIRLARALELRVIAEGVESEHQRSRLASCGCSEFQGFLVGMPMAPDRIEDLAGEASLAQPEAAIRRTG